MFWVAGFDTLYGLQDMDIDRNEGLFSIPCSFGVRTALWTARLFHIATLLLLISLICIFKLSGIYLLGLFVISGLLIYEHSLIRADDLSRLDIAFFNMNGYISITFFIFTLGSYIFV
jgi:4-hydroxybenzoate polyprenyltransferase